jgi:hypothetical protein
MSEMTPETTDFAQWWQNLSEVEKEDLTERHAAQPEFTPNIKETLLKGVTGIVTEKVTKAVEEQLKDAYREQTLATERDRMRVNEEQRRNAEDAKHGDVGREQRQADRDHRDYENAGSAERQAVHDNFKDALSEPDYSPESRPETDFDF